MNKIKNYKLMLILMIMSLIFISSNVVNAETDSTEQEVYESLLSNDTEEEASVGNITYPSGITREMTDSSYWKDLSTDVDKILMTKEEIVELNEDIVEGAGTYVVDLETVQNPTNAGYDTFNSQLYIDGEPIDQDEYINKFDEGNGSIDDILYAIVVKRADIKCWPTNEIVGYSPNDPDDEIQLYSLNVNEPVVIRDICEVDGEVFYYCQSRTCAGWIYGNNIAICDSMEEWLDCWKFDINDKDILVVTESKITLEPSVQVSSTSEVQLMLGTILKLVPENEIPENIGERGTWFNYVVYLPTRDADGKYVKQYALISQRYNVSIGYLDLTQANILDVAFSCLGDRYGWGGMLGSYDCSAYTKAIYKCFGLEIPRNTTWQQKIPGRLTSLAGMTDEEKIEYFKTIPAGSLLYFPGHAMVYIGTKTTDGENGNTMSYVISDTGSLSDSDGDVKVRSMYTVILNPLTTRRGNGHTWLNQLTAVVTFGEIEQEQSSADEEEPNNNNEEQSTNQEQQNNNEQSSNENQQNDNKNSEEQNNDKSEQQNNDKENVEQQDDNNQNKQEQSATEQDTSKENEQQSVIEEKMSYNTLEGENQKITSGNEMTFRFDIDYSKFLESGKVYIDTQLIDSTKYTSKQGSTVLTFAGDYTSTLSEGEHSIKVAVADGEVTTKFEVAKEQIQDETASKNEDEVENNEEKVNQTSTSSSETTDNTKTSNSTAKNTKTSNPKTGDTGIAIWVGLIIVSLSGIVVIVKFTKTNNETKTEKRK